MDINAGRWDAGLCDLFGARAFLQFTQVRFRLAQARLGGIGDRRLPVRFLFAHEAARHQA